MFGLFGRKGDASSTMASVNAKGVVSAGGIEYSCRIRRRSDERMTLTLDRLVPLSGAVIVVDLKEGLAFDAMVAESKGADLTLSIRKKHDLRGLVPARLSRARDLFSRG